MAKSNTAEILDLIDAPSEQRAETPDGSPPSAPISVSTEGGQPPTDASADPPKKGRRPGAKSIPLESLSPEEQKKRLESRAYHREYKRKRREKLAEAQSPFAAPIAGEAAGTVQPTQKAPTAQINILAKLPAKELAQTLVDVSSSAIVALGSLRYGEQSNILAFAKEEKDVLVPLTTEWLKEQAVAATPGEALAVALLVMLGSRVVVLESQRAQQIAEAKAQRNVPPT